MDTPSQKFPAVRREKQECYLALALPLQVHHTHVHDGPEVGEGLHGHHVGSLLVAVHVELGINPGITFCPSRSRAGKGRARRRRENVSASPGFDGNRVPWEHTARSCHVPSRAGNLQAWSQRTPLRYPGRSGIRQWMSGKWEEAGGMWQGKGLAHTHTFHH